MSQPLTRTEQQLQNRYLALADRLNQDLGFKDGRLYFARRFTRSRSVTYLLQTSALREQGLPADSLCTIGLSGRYAVSMHLASYAELWAFSSRTSYRFESSNLRFVIAADDGGGTLPLRLEWAGRGDDGSGRLVFPGQGAAHPHWQIDLHELVFPESVATEVTIDVDARDTVEEIDLDTVGVEPRVSPHRKGFLGWVHRVHLPVRAMWHAQVCAMPNDPASHQHEPTTVDEVDSWILSAVRYVRHEFDTYA